MIKGIYHCHSEYSYDGKMPLEYISSWCKSNLFDFVILTEHANNFNHEKFERFYKECSCRSNGVRLIPGIEYEFIINGKPVHVGVINTKNFFLVDSTTTSIEKYLEYFKSSGALVVLHHPFRAVDDLSSEVYKQVDFIEAWNTVHDIRYSPNTKIVETTKRHGFSGRYLASSDVHNYSSKNKYPNIEVYCDVNAEISDIFTMLLSGCYKNICEKWIIEPNGMIKSISDRKTYLLPYLSKYHQNCYEMIRNVYYKFIKTPPPKYIIDFLK